MSDVKAPTPSPASVEAESTARFIEERKYLKGASPASLEWYKYSFRAFSGALGSEADIKSRIIHPGARGEASQH